MARKGLPVSGWVILDKPAGLGSTPAVAMVRRAFGAAKAGHAGTLDPAATGVLAVAMGEATKTVPYLEAAAKCYRFRVRWGAETATDDAGGAVTATAGARPDPEAIKAALSAFRGDILQVPPQVSAVKVDGARAYDLAREGVVMDLAPRALHVERLDYLGQPDAGHADFELVCGKGGYVRGIARDLGRALGCLGHVLWLRRLWSGPFRAQDGHAPDAVLALAGMPELATVLLPLERALAAVTRVDVTADMAAHLRRGAAVAAPGNQDVTVWAALDGRAVAVGRVRDGLLHPARVFAATSGDV